MQNMFYHNKELNDASAINNWNITSVSDFTNMFGGYTTVHPNFTKVAGTWDNNGTFIPNS